MSVPRPSRTARTRPPAPDPAWAARGACANHPDPDLWFTEADETRQHTAAAICATCPVTAECLGYALSVPHLSGIWGGTTPTMRTRLRNQASRHTAA